MNDIHPCLGKNCIECETCIYDRPLDMGSKPTTRTLRADEICNYCGYLIKQYRDCKDTKFNACCSKARIEASNYSRPRTIDFNLTEGKDIERPEWCPKSNESTIRHHETANRVEEYMSYTEKRDKLKAMPPHVEWNDLHVGRIYIVPSILGRKRKILMPKFKSEYTLVCNDVTEDGQVTNNVTNIYKTDIDTNFIVELKDF